MADLIEKNSKVAIVGGGLVSTEQNIYEILKLLQQEIFQQYLIFILQVGALQACILAKHGYEVDLYEYREGE